MDIDTVSNNGFDIAVLDGALTVSELASLTPVLSSLIKDHPENSIVIDMSKVTDIDTSALRLFQNIQKKMTAENRLLYLLNPGEDQMQQISSSESSSAIKVIHSISELQQNVNTSLYKQYHPYTFNDGSTLNRLRLTCGICGSPNVFGYLINKNDYEWKWPAEDYFPECLSRTEEQFDFFGTLPIVCTDCLAASTEIAHFNIVDENNTVKYHTSLNDQIKLLLSKSLKKRKKILEDVSITIGDNFFKGPRDRTAALYCYLLAESCAKISSISYDDGNMFTVGLLNYISLLYCNKSMKPTLIDNCRTYLTQVVSAPDRYNIVQLAQAYYIIFVSSLSLGKIKDLTKIMDSYSELMEQNASVDDPPNSLESPTFWFNRANEIWKNEISSKSSAFLL